MLCDNLKRYRKEKNLSQEELAKNAGITYSTLIKIESGNNTNPTVKTLQQIAKALEVTLDDLMQE